MILVNVLYICVELPCVGEFTPQACWKNYELVNKPISQVLMDNNKYRVLSIKYFNGEELCLD